MQVALWVKALPLEWKGSRFKPHWVLGWAYGPNLVMRLPVTLVKIVKT